MWGHYKTNSKERRTVLKPDADKEGDGWDKSTARMSRQGQSIMGYLKV